MPVKIDYETCCWNAEKLKISGVPKTKKVFEQDGKCTSCSCKGACEGCVEACPVEALKRGKIVEIDKSKCIECGACVAACEHDAISLS